MPYTPPIFYAVNAELRPAGSTAPTIPIFTAVNAELAVDPTGESGSTSQALLVAGVDAGEFGATKVVPAIRPIDLDGFGPDLLELGTPAIENTAQFVEVFGAEQLEAGYPEVMNLRSDVLVHGIDSLELGYGEIENKARVIEVYGEELCEAGEPAIFHRRRDIALEDTGIGSQEFGSQRVEFALRVIAAEGPFTEEFGAAAVGDRTFHVEPGGIEAPEFETGHELGTVRVLQPDGFEATEWLTRITPDDMAIEAQGSEHAVFGGHAVALWRNFIAPGSVRLYPEPQQYFGLALAFNLRRYIVLADDDLSELRPPPWPLWTAIENRDRTLAVLGAPAPHLLGADVALSARGLAPGPMELPSWGTAHRVEYAVRAVSPPGLDPPLLSSWASVHNDARVLRVAGWAGAAYGQASIVNTRRYRNVQGFDSGAFGVAFVADRIRTLAPAGIVAPDAGRPESESPTVYLFTRYVWPALGDTSRWGVAGVESRFNILRPYWPLFRDPFGSPTARNVTPELRAYGVDATEFGTTFVRLQWRAVLPQPVAPIEFSRPLVAPRTRTVQVSAGPAGAIGSDTKAIRIGTDPPSLQTIELRKFHLDPDTLELTELEQGHGFHAALFGSTQAELAIRLARPASLGDLAVFGQTTARNMGLRTIGFDPAGFGAVDVRLHLRQISVSSLGQQVKDGASWAAQGSFGLPAVSPHTIYAVYLPSLDAQRNHPPVPKPGGYVGHWPPPPAAGETFGELEVQNQHRPVYPRHDYNNPPNMMGAPQITLVQPNIAPRGITAPPFGVHMIPTTPRVVRLDSHGIPEPMDRSSWPKPLVQHADDAAAGGPSNRLVTAKPIEAPAISKHLVEMLHRTLSLPGLSTLQMGSSRLPTERMPQSLYVGPPFLNQMTGLDALDVGIAWISNQIRQVEVAGFDDLRSEYDPATFAYRMRVLRGAAPPASRVIQPAPFIGADGPGLPALLAIDPPDQFIIPLPICAIPYQCSVRELAHA